MNRKLRRTLEKKLGSDFPFDQFLALYGYYNSVMHLDVNEFMIYLLKRYVPALYVENKTAIDAMGGTEDEL